MTHRGILSGLAALLLLAPSAASGAIRTEYFGIVQGQFDVEGQLDDQDLQGMQSARIRTDRFELSWKSLEPTKGTFRWAGSDHFIGALASHGIRALPFIWKSPRWVASSTSTPPLDSAADQEAWQTFLQALVARYGPGGTYWRNRYRQDYGASATPLPITSWQIWNEPNLRKFFDPGGTDAQLAPKYGALLRISHAAIASRDPQAQVVLAGAPGYPPSGGPHAWDFLAQLYNNVPNVKSYFDVAAIHPYAADVSHVQLEVEKFRTVMRNHGDGATPLWITEIGWGSDPPDQFGINQGPEGQRQRLVGAYSLFLNHRTQWNLQRVYWFLWRDPNPNSRFAHRCSFCASAGVLRYNRTQKQSYSALRSFTADTNPPTAQFTSGPQAGVTINDPTPTFTFGATDPGSIFECRIDAGPFELCPERYTTPSLADGTHRLYLRAIDAPGNVSETKLRPFTVDTTPPALAITLGPANGSATSSTTASFAFTNDDPSAIVTCQLDNGGFAACSSPFSTPTLGDGVHAFQVRATDPVGNVATIGRIWTVDTIPPVASITSGPDEGSTSPDPRPSFGFDASEAGVRFECQLDAGGFAACSSPYSVSARLPNAPHTFEVRAIDRAGNVGPVTTRTWTVDAPPVDVRIDGGPAPDAVIRDPTPSFAFSSSDDQASFKCRVGGDADPFVPCALGRQGSGTFTTPPLRDGHHRFSVEAVDGAEVSPIASRSFTVDTKAPETTISSGPADGSVSSNRSPSFSFAASEPGSTFECRLEARKFAACSSPRSLGPLSDGGHVFRVRAIDPAGNVGAAASRSFAIDTEAPRLAIKGPRRVRTATRRASALFVLKASERVHRHCRIDSKRFEPCAWRYRTPKLGQGAHTLDVKAVDRAGNVAARQKRFKIVAKARG